MNNFSTDILRDFWTSILTIAPIFLKKSIFLVILYLTYKPVKFWIVSLVQKFLHRKKVEELLIDFISNLVTAIIIIFYVLNIIQILGLKVTALLTILVSIGIGIGLALQGSVSDVASGINILVSKPFRKGDYVVLGSMEGTISKITFLYSLINTGDNRRVIVPNRKLSSSVVTVVTANTERRADFTFYAEKDSSVDKVKDILFGIASNHPCVLKNKDIFIKFSKETQTALEFIVRVWTVKGDYKDVNADIQEEVKRRFDEEGIKFPYDSYLLINEN